MITFTTDSSIQVNLTEEEFRNTAKDMIKFALYDKEYTLEQVDYHMIAEDITGVMTGEHGMSEEGLKIIKEELEKFEEDGMMYSEYYLNHLTHGELCSIMEEHAYEDGYEELDKKALIEQLSSIEII